MNLKMLKGESRATLAVLTMVATFVTVFVAGSVEDDAMWFRMLISGLTYLVTFGAGLGIARTIRK